MKKIFYQYFIYDNEESETYRWEAICDYSNLYTDKDKCIAAAKERIEELKLEVDTTDDDRFQYAVYQQEVEFSAKDIAEILKS